MKINPSHISNITNIYRNNCIKSESRPQRAANKTRTDEVQLSDEAKSLGLALKKAKASLDVRLDKVEQIKKLIDSGKYNVSSSDVADKIVESILFDKKV